MCRCSRGYAQKLDILNFFLITTCTLQILGGGAGTCCLEGVQGRHGRVLILTLICQVIPLPLGIFCSLVGSSTKLQGLCLDFTLISWTEKNLTWVAKDLLIFNINLLSMIYIKWNVRNHASTLITFISIEGKIGILFLVCTVYKSMKQLSR